MPHALASLVETLGPPVSDADFRSWLRRARAGERLAYHRGFLVRDRAPGTPLGAPERARVDALAATALAAAEAGRVHLVQRRLGEGDFVYVVIRAHDDLVSGDRDDRGPARGSGRRPASLRHDGRHDR